MTAPTRQPIIGVVGAATCDHHTAAVAHAVGTALARAGAVLVCGGLGGVMEAACAGAVAAGGLTIGLLPGDDRSAANPYVTLALPTGMGQARNVLIVQAAEAVIAIAGEYGTLSEIALARKLGRPVVGLASWELGTDADGNPHLPTAATPAAAVHMALAGCTTQARTL